MTDEKFKTQKSKTSIGMKKALGTLNKSIKMIEDDEYCPDIIQQIDAAIGLLSSVKKNLLRGHLDHCLELNMKKDKQKAIEELVRVFDLK